MCTILAALAPPTHSAMWHASCRTKDVSMGSPKQRHIVHWRLLADACGGFGWLVVVGSGKSPKEWALCALCKLLPGRVFFMLFFCTVCFGADPQRHQQSGSACHPFEQFRHPILGEYCWSIRRYRGAVSCIVRAYSHSWRWCQGCGIYTMPPHFPSIRKPAKLSVSQRDMYACIHPGSSGEGPVVGCMSACDALTRL